MNLQPRSGTSAQRRAKSTRVGGELQCLRCRHRFTGYDLSHVQATGDKHAYIECVWCEAHNEVRTTVQAGGPPRTVVLRIMMAP